MALSITQTVRVGEVLKQGMQVASLGYPDLIAPMGLVEQILGEKFPDLTYRADSETICKHHGLKSRDIPDSTSFFSLLGAELDVYDIIQHRGDEILCDLNHPFSANKYDVVLDVGTAEHCFNIGQALINMASLVKVGGYILHENPFNTGNHGFYGINPTLFADFYEANGFEVLECRLATRDGRGAEVPRTKRFRFVEEEANTFCMARRLEEREFVFPVQTKYKKSLSPGVAGG